MVDTKPEMQPAFSSPRPRPTVGGSQEASRVMTALNVP